MSSTMPDVLKLISEDNKRLRARNELMDKLLQEFYDLNANGVFSLPDANYALITATAAVLDK